MTGRDVPDNEMLYLPWHTLPDVRAIEALLSGDGTPADAPAGLSAVAEVFTALRGPADQHELAEWGQALVAYRELVGYQEEEPSPARRQRRRSRLIAALLGAKLAAAGAGIAIAAALGGGIAAYTDSLPAVLQKIAHDTIAAPGAHTSKPGPTWHRPGHPVGPSSAGRAKHGLCTAYQHGNASKRAVAFRNLVAAAGGVGKVAAYCAQSATSSHGSPGSPGRRTGQVSSSAHPARHKPAIPPGVASHGNGDGNGNGHGKK